MSLTRSVSPPEASQLGSQAAESPVSTAAGAAAVGSTDDRVLFEGYLFKVPPLKKSLLMVSDVVTINLCYYKDINKKGEPRHINLSKITGIRPSSKVGSSDHIFAIETEDRKYILKAQDHNTKNIWLAKLCELCGQEVVYHVTIPKQSPITNFYNEAIMRFGVPDHVEFALPSSNTTIFSVPHSDIRRLGLSNSSGYSVLWLEMCHNSVSDQFFFVLIPSGYDSAKQILQELKVAIQARGRPLIKEESGNLEFSYIARNHYGCQEFSPDKRYYILENSLYKILSSQSPHGSPLLAFSNRFFPPIAPQGMPLEMKRDLLQSSFSQSEIVVPNNGSGGRESAGVSLEEFGRRKTYSRCPQTAMTRRPTLDKFVRLNSTSSFERHMSTSSEERPTKVSPFERTSPESFATDTETDCDGESSSHFSSGSGSDVFESTIAANGVFLKNKLSLQSSLSSQNSAPYSSSSHSPPILEEVVTNSFTFERTPSVNTPAVPPRSMISLAEVTPAH